MNKKYFPLGSIEPGIFVKTIKIIFGSLCISVALYWLFFSPVSMKSGGTLWITVIFMTGFGLYQIWSGLGKAAKFIEFSDKSIKIKKSIFLPPIEINSSDLEKTELFPMSMIFLLRSKKKIILRFGAVYQETNETIKDEMFVFSDANNIPVEIKQEEI